MTMRKIQQILSLSFLVLVVSLSVGTNFEKYVKPGTSTLSADEIANFDKNAPTFGAVR